MAEIHGRLGLCLPVTLSNEKAPSPIRACLHSTRPASGAWEPLTADARPITDPVPSRPGRHPTTTTRRPALFVHADLKRE
jgi:hypothetical protein